VANASVEFDVATLRPTFRLIHGIPGSSSGIEIARRLGLDEELIGLARELVPQEEREVAQFSFLLRQQMEQAGRLKEKLLGERRELERERLELKSRYQKQMEELKRETEKIWQRSRQQFETETQKLLAEIKDKFVAVRARREIEKKGARLREQALAELSQPATRTNPTSLASPSTEVAALSVGSRVRVKRFGQEGTIVASLKEGEWEVAVGNLKLVARSEELESTGRKEDLQEIRPARITVQMSSPELQSNDLNLIGCTAEEAISKTDRFLDQAYLASIPTVRLIHGAGMGILKRALAEWLATQPLVEKFHAASPEQGGNAITVVSLKT
jgi:DNA mismatch repair protein MutS2